MESKKNSKLPSFPYLFFPSSLQDCVVMPTEHVQKEEEMRCEVWTVWKVDTHKCVDASPLLVRTRTVLQAPHGLRSKDTPPSEAPPPPLLVVYVGSHSHLFLALELGSGRVFWRVELGGRVESSACSSACGDFVVVGE